MRHVAAKFVPSLLTEDQQKSWLTVCQDLKRELENDPNFLSRVITGDESWYYGYDPESKQASSQWKIPRSPRPKKIRQVRSNVKTMLICFFDIQGIVHRGFVPRGQTVNQEIYLGFWNDWGRGCGGQGRNCGDRANGSFTMTNLPHTRRSEFVNFWPLRAWHLCPIPPTHLTWPPPPFFSPEWKGTLKGADLTLWRTLSQLQQEHWTASKLRSSTDVSNSRNRDWISAYHPMESTWKATNEFFVILYINQSLMKKSRFFWVPPRIQALIHSGCAPCTADIKLDFKLLPQSRWDLHSSGLLYSE